MVTSRQRAGRGLQQGREIEMIGAEADAEFAQGRAGGLIERLRLAGHARPLQNADRFGELEGDAAPDAFEPLARFEFGKAAK